MSAALPTRGGELRILVAEPSRTLSSLIRAALAELGAEIELAPDGAQALALAKNRVPDLLVADQALPVLDGYALAHSLKALAGHKKIATLLLVPEHASPDPERLAYVGIEEVLVKPFERAVLLERVRNLLELPHRFPTGRLEHRASARAADPHEPRRPDHRLLPPATDGGGGGSVFEPAPAPPSEALIEHVSAAVMERLELRLGTIITQRLPSLLDAALTRLLPQAVMEATRQAVAERVPGAVEGAARLALAELATPTRIDRIVAEVAHASADKAVAAALAPLVQGGAEALEARIERELRQRLDAFVETELPKRLTAHAEQVVWKTVPAIAEDLVREEIKRLTAE